MAVVLNYARISFASSRLDTNMVRFICIFLPTLRHPGLRPGMSEGGAVLSAKLLVGAADGGSSHPRLDPRGVEKHLAYQLRRVPDRQQMSHCIGNCVIVVGFREGPASHGEIALFEDCRAGGNDQPDRRPPISDVMG